MKKTALYLLGTLSIYAPLILEAQTKPTSIKTLATFLIFYINKIIPIVILMTFFVFIWGMGTFIRQSDNDDAIKKGKRLMLVGIFALFIAFAYRSIYIYIADELGLSTPEYSNIIDSFINEDEIDNIIAPI